MISSQNLIDKICCALTTGGLTPVQCCSAESALTILCQPVFSVACCASLPNATTYNGRMVYVTNETKYYYAVCGVWSDDFSSTPHAIRCDIWSWGSNCRIVGTVGNGQLGDNTTITKLSPVSVVGGFTDWKQISAGFYNSAGVRTSGTAWVWGYNSFGRLGDGTTMSRSSPVSVIGGFTDWCGISAGSAVILGIRSNGTAWAFGGQNANGNLGDNTTVSKSSPVSVVGGFTDWCQVSSGSLHSQALRQNGTAWGWGAGSYGRLGTGNTFNQSSPTSAVGGFTDWCQISAGSYHSLAVRQNGTAWAWGNNTQGRLGDGTTVSKTSPVSVVGGFTDWCQVSGGQAHSLGVRQNGTAWAWGCNGQGRLGDGTTVSKLSPVSVVGGFTDWCQISASLGNHSLAVRQTGTAWAWGCNTQGQLGDNNSSPRSSPVSVVGGICDWSQVSAGGIHSLGLRLTTVGL